MEGEETVGEDVETVVEDVKGHLGHIGLDALYVSRTIGNWIGFKSK